MDNTIQPMTKKDYFLSFLAGFLIGLLLLPILKAAKPELYTKFGWVLLPLFIIATPFGLAIFHMIARKIAVFWQLGKFGVTGVLNFCVDLGVLSLLQAFSPINSKTVIFSGIAFLTFYSIYKATSFIIANINSYFWNKYWAFHSGEDKKNEFFQFFIVSIVGFLVNVVVASLVFKSVAGFSAGQAGLIGAVVGSIAGLAWNFIGYKFIVFKK